jgi:hypothetical protein
MWRPLRAVVVAVVVTALSVAASAPAASSPGGVAPPGRLGTWLGKAWTTGLEIPAPENPFAGGDPCLHLDGRAVVPLAPPVPGSAVTCTVAPGTKTFVMAFSTECSTAEVGTDFFGRDEAELRECARALDADMQVTATLDGRPIRLAEVESPLLHLDLPADNIFGVAGPDRQALSVAHGWVALLHPLPPGTHTITIQGEGTYLDDDLEWTNVTTIVVAVPGASRRAS